MNASDFPVHTYHGKHERRREVLGCPDLTSLFHFLLLCCPNLSPPPGPSLKQEQQQLMRRVSLSLSFLVTCIYTHFAMCGHDRILDTASSYGRLVRQDFLSKCPGSNDCPINCASAEEEKPAKSESHSHAEGSVPLPYAAGPPPAGRTLFAADGGTRTFEVCPRAETKYGRAASATAIIFYEGPVRRELRAVSDDGANKANTRRLTFGRRRRGAAARGVRADPYLSSTATSTRHGTPRAWLRVSRSNSRVLGSILVRSVASRRAPSAPRKERGEVEGVLTSYRVQSSRRESCS
ncbi:hypothetical protein EVAR_30411_1 [Eumeta japonica]|uniref:Uncharacterized protein n=1 Tax=Eumeta variegata TaxID=151549 RepID=A0A4C1W5T6_EUMVA|nr:hypothetical protein EVAR_30411_1 [Eumeta japonica]